MIDTIYLDMDGVICDFDKLYYSTYGINCRDDHNKNNWYEFVKNEGFYNLPATKNADRLIDKLFSLNVNVVILSCISDRSDSKQVRKQKMKWLQEYNIGHLPTIFTKTKIEKSDHATPTSLLIDDSSACINPFKQKGGYGILHENVKDTVSQLDCFIDKGLLCALLSVQEA